MKDKNRKENRETKLVKCPLVGSEASPFIDDPDLENSRMLDWLISALKKRNLDPAVRRNLIIRKKETAEKIANRMIEVMGWDNPVIKDLTELSVNSRKD